MAFVATLLVAVAVAADARAALTELIVHGGTGQIWLHNPNATPFDFVYYSISSTGGALDGSNGVWTSIADTYDLSGDGSVDPSNDWTELSAAATMLAEGVFVGDGGTLAVDQSVSLGLIWNPTAEMGDLSAQVVEVSETPEVVAMPVVFRSYDSDFDFDFDVDLVDLATWRTNFGTGTLHSQGDADLDGDVDGDDFLIWQQDVASVLTFGSGAGSGVGALSVATVPEPTAAWLLCAGSGAWLLARRARWRRRPRRRPRRSASQNRRGDWLILRSLRSKMCLSPSPRRFC